ncbi:alpha galactosidase A [Trichococcus patagoniensis]|uniref:Alpha-galactosidase n=1 Tax=Trichococcus patagoniensis TaxID=382641 RepID=A0A2T5IDA3_9LACT|nr:glycoside hydrolase family 27 protein [Trichococcus patagoniensis]PTQ81794.1 alpha galactosidase A [Trichococcus patagoniensis]
MFRDYAPTPPKGWNSWDSFGASVTEAEVLGNAEVMAEKLKEFGWEYVVVDIQWYEPHADSCAYHPFAELNQDEYSRLLPAENRFPSAAGGRGFKPLADAVHGMGLKFGIHIMRGIPRQAVHNNTKIFGAQITAREIADANSICPWNTDMYGVDPSKQGAQAYYDSLLALYASWGVDFLKVDDIADSKLYGTHTGEIELIRKAIDGCGRPMVLSLSPGPAPIAFGTFFQRNANMWRLTDDLWDNWDQLHDMFGRCAKWSAFVGAGAWPDCDMLPLGHIGTRTAADGTEARMTRFTKDEQRSLMTLWSIFRSPLMFGGDLRNLDAWSQSLLTNPYLIDAHQDGRVAREVYRKDDLVIWVSESDARQYVACFNLSDEPVRLPEAAGEWLQSIGEEMHEVWGNRTVSVIDAQTAFIAPHGVALYVTR